MKKARHLPGFLFSVSGFSFTAAAKTVITPTAGELVTVVIGAAEAVEVAFLTLDSANQVCFGLTTSLDSA